MDNHPNVSFYYYYYYLLDKITQTMLFYNLKNMFARYNVACRVHDVCVACYQEEEEVEAPEQELEEEVLEEWGEREGDEISVDSEIELSDTWWNLLDQVGRLGINNPSPLSV